MGIPRFFKFITQHFRQAVLESLDLDDKSYVDGLWIDLNSPIHNICQRTFKYGLNRELNENDFSVQQKFRNMSVEKRRKILFDNIGIYLITAYLKINPIKTFMIAVDGVAPQAKMTQQRMRRFRPSGAPLDFFDPVVISPGTRFMDDLDNYIKKQWLIDYKGVIKPTVKLIYSNHREPGEGEHKIFHQMSIKQQGRTTTSMKYARKTPYHVVLGADSDLIVLSMGRTDKILFMRDKLPDWNDRDKPDILETAINSNLTLLVDGDCFTNLNDVKLQKDIINARWNKTFDKGFTYIKIHDVRNMLNNQFIRPNNVIDFTLITFFVGNDFLPPIPEFSSVIAMSKIYMTDGDIESRFEQIHNVKMRQNKREGKKTFKFNPTLFWIGFTKREAGTYVPKPYGKNVNKPVDKNINRAWITKNKKGEPIINVWESIGIYNSVQDQTEIYPKIKDPMTGEMRRIMLYKSNTGKWKTPKRDIGSLIGALMIYKNIMDTEKEVKRGGGDNFLITGKSSVNYVNLYRFLGKLMSRSDIFMESNFAQYNELVKRNRPPDQLIKESMGLLGSFNEIHKMKSFAIYDSEHADKRLPKIGIDEMCRKWLEGIQWTMLYYTSGYESMNIQWFYPYKESPSIFDLHRYLGSRIITSVTGLPNIRISSEISTHEYATKVIIDGGEIFIYQNHKGQTVYLLRETAGKSRFLDHRKFKLYTANNRPNRSETDDMIYILEFGRTEIKQNVTRQFVNKQMILDVVSNGESSYSNIVQSFFSIMPIRVLKQILDPQLVNVVVAQISDMFPEKFEMIEDGKFYEGQSEPKIPFVSPTRIEEAINSENITSNQTFQDTINRLNTSHRRYKFNLSKSIPVAVEIKKQWSGFRR